MQVFISYAREDRIYLERLLRFLSVLEKRGIISVWYDSLLPAGVRFAAEIDECIDRADIFIALISIDFLGSAFCFDHELGRARSVAAQRELTILPVLVSPCDWAATELGTYNALPFGSEYLSESPQVDRLLHAIAREIEKLAMSRSSTRESREPAKRPVTPLRVPQLPSQYVRPARTFDGLKAGIEFQYQENLADPSRRAVGLALCGLAGSGKTCLAIDVARADYVVRTFTDGVIWLHCGREAEPVGIQRRLLQWLGVQRTLSDLWQDNVEAVGEAIDGKSLLLVLDDVWSVDQASAFTTGATNGTMLFLTTRFENVARWINARTVSIEKPSLAESLRILANYSRVPLEQLPSLSSQIVRLSGQLPLALAVIGSLIENHVFGWNSLLSVLESSRDRAVIMRFETRLTDYEWRSITAAFDASINTLSPQASDALLMCRALGRSMTVPRRVFMAMTASVHLGDLGSYLDIEEALVSRSLVLRSTDASDDVLLSFHDLIVDYCHEHAKDRENPHDVILRNTVDDTDRNNSVVRARALAREPYWQDEIFRHMAASVGYRELGVDTILDLGWLTERIDDFGVDRLILDCSELDQFADVRRLRDALRLCSHTLASSSEELLIQLDGRLPNEFIDGILHASDFRVRGTFKPRALRKNFTSADDPVDRILFFDGTPVYDLVMVSGGTQLVARCANGQISVVDLSSRRVEYSITPPAPVTLDAAAHDGANEALIFLGVGDRILELDVLQYRMSILEPSSEDSGILNNLVRTSTSQKAFLGWTRDAVYRVAVNSAGRCFALELIASDRRTVSCELHGESGLFVIVEIGGLISWGQIDALVLLTDRFEAGGEIRSARLYDNGLRALLFFYSGEVAALDLRRGEFAWRVPVHRDWIETTELDEQAGILVTGGHDQDVVVTDISDGAEKLRLHGGSGYIKDVIVFSVDQPAASRKYVAWSTLDGAIRVSQIDGGQQAIALGHSGRINRMLAARNNELVSCSDDGTVRFWAVPRIFRSYAATDDHVEKVSCVASTDALAWSAGYDGSVMARDVRSGDLLGRAQVVDEPLHTLVPFNGSLCLIGTESGQVFTAEIRGSSAEVALTQVTQLGGWISAMRPITSSGLIALGTGAGELALYDCRHGFIVSVVELHAGAIRSLEASGNGRYLYTGGEDGRIVRFDLNESAPAGEVAAHDDWVHKMLMHEGAGLLLSISDDATLRAFDPLSLERRSPVLRHDGWLADVLVRPDGRVIFTMGQDGDIYAWDSVTFELLSRTPAHSAWISGAALVASGRALVTVAHDQAIRLWSTYELSRLGTITIDTGANVNCLNVVGQRTLVVGGINGKVFLVRLDDNSALEA